MPGRQNVGNQNGNKCSTECRESVFQMHVRIRVSTGLSGNAIGNNGNPIRCYNCIGLGYLVECTVRPRRRDAADLDEIEEVNANCILMANLQQASTSGTQTDKAPVYDSDGSAEKTENENVELDFCLPKINESHALSKPVTSNSVPTTTETNVVKNDKVIAPGMFRINPSKASREENFVPINKARESVKTNPITFSQPHVITKKENDRVPSAPKSSCIKNKEVEVEEHHRNLLPSKNKKHMSSECNNVKLAIRNDKSEVGKKQKENVSNTENQKKQKPTVRKPKKVGSKERLASPKPSKHRMCLRWSPTGRIFDLCGKIIESSKSEGCSNHMTGNLKLLINFVWKFLGTVHFGYDHIAAILGYGELQRGNILSPWVYFVEGFGVGTSYQSYSVRTPPQNGVVERRNRTLVEAARTMLIFSCGLLFLWDQAIATACYTQNPPSFTVDLINTIQCDIGFFIGYSANSCAYRVYNRRTKKIMETMNLKLDELSAIAFEQIRLQTEIVADNVPNAMLDGNSFVNPFAPSSKSDAESSSSQYVDPSNMHTFYQPYPHEYLWTKDHLLEQVIGEPP
ncbi:retrovirus-related pol polyprotein from transposon TNT 1-94 [Tanacetum coccineum]|uniref:Retrovirus-related pol polyprotein from transposon TNT 1-94 n=1 Tax=Tanacetum coccineum TaxID=301880 RepID=A0ABQ5DQN5_9ASTR